MRENWKYKSFEDCLHKVPKQQAVKSKDYLENGLFPIVSQESDLISGYTSDENILYKHEKPVIIFGDHTKNIKYIDFNFVVGADGVHILSVKDDILPKFFYYELCSIKLRNLGYARHYKLLKEKEIGYPDIAEQERIVALLDDQFAKIDALKANAASQLQAAKDLFQSALKEMLTPKEGWERIKLTKVCESITAGGDAPKGRVRDEKDENFCYPIYSNGVENEGLYGYTNDYKYNKPAITVAARGTIGAAFIRYVPFTPIVRLITLIPDSDKADIGFMYYIIKSLNIGHTGSSIPQLTVPMIKEMEFSFPSLPEQERIAARLDAISEKVKALQANYDQTINLCNDLKQSLLKSIFA